VPTNFAYITKVGGTASGTGELEFNAPRGLATDGSYLYVCDTGNHRIKKLTLKGLQFVAHWGDLDSNGAPTSGTGNTGFSSPEGIHHREGYLFIADRGNNRIKIHRATDGRYINEFGTLSAPRGVTGNHKYLWVVDSGNSRIVRYDIPTLTADNTAGSNGSGNNQLNGPLGITFDQHERCIYIADNTNTRLLKWNAYEDMTYIAVISSIGSPVSAVVSDDLVYVTLAASITAYDTSTLTSQSVGLSSGTGNGNISTGSYIIAHERNLIFTEIGNNRLQIVYNYRPQRAYDTGESLTIDGQWFVNPTVPIGGDQQGEFVTIGGTAQSDLIRWVEEERAAVNGAWSEE
jgi:sugar lactone lactonase YvrE